MVDNEVMERRLKPIKQPIAKGENELIIKR